MVKKIIVVSGMTCNHCEKRIRKTLKELKGIKSVIPSFKTGLVEIEYDDKKVNETDISKCINDLGYKYRGFKNNKKIVRTTFRDVLPIFITLIIIYLIIGSVVGFDFINFIPEINTTAPLIMLFIIGLLTSVHCVGMCGAINLAVSTSDDNIPSIKRPLFYNIGRIISYTITGAIVGGLGSIIAFNIQIQGFVIFMAAIFMLMMGLSMLGWLPGFLNKFLPRMPSKFRGGCNNNRTPFIAGLLNGLMPCGPLQAMQLYALSTGSILLGAASMFIFSLGTVPLVFGFGLLFSALKGKHHITIQRISSILVILLSVVMLTRAFVYWGIDFKQISHDLFTQNIYKGYEIAEIKNDVQYVEIELNSSGYTPILVQKDIPVIFNIKVENVEAYGCTNSIIIDEFNIQKDLVNGDNLIEFTPTETGDFVYSCWMRMVTSNIKVIDDLSVVNKDI